MTTLVTVNRNSLDLLEALRYSIIHSDDERFLNNRIDELLIRDYAAKNNITNSLEELQVAADEVRYEKGLESAEKLRQWMKSNHQTVLSLQNDINYRLLHNKVKGSIPDKEVEAYFAEHQLEYDRVELYSIRLDSMELAEELYAQITEEGKNFHLVAMQHSLDEESKPKAGYVGKVSRAEVSAEIEAAVFNAQLGEVIGPIKTEQGYNLFKVGAVYPANLEAEREDIRFQLFVNLLSRLRAEAKITYPIFEEES